VEKEAKQYKNGYRRVKMLHGDLFILTVTMKTKEEEPLLPAGEMIYGWRFLRGTF